MLIASFSAIFVTEIPVAPKPRQRYKRRNSSGVPNDKSSQPMNERTNPNSDVASRPASASSSLWNKDLAPIPRNQRTWGTYNYAALWVAMSVNIPTYMLASAMIAGGMNWKQALVTVFLGNVIVLIPMLLNAHAGAQYGIPFPVFARSSFGVLGANVPAILRALVACGWFGIQAWIGGWAIYKILAIYFPAWEAMPPAFLGISLPQLACFLLFWGANMLVIYKGIDSIRILLNVKAPLLIVLGLAL